MLSVGYWQGFINIQVKKEENRDQQKCDNKKKQKTPTVQKK